MAFKNDIKVLSASSPATVLYTCPAGAEASIHSLVVDAETETSRVSLFLHRQASGQTIQIVDLDVTKHSPFTFPKPINLTPGDYVSARCVTQNATVMISVFENSSVTPATAFNPRGEYDPAATYNRLDVVSYNGSSFICATDGVTGNTPPAPPWMASGSADTGALLSANNLSDISDAPEARRNLSAMAATWAFKTAAYTASPGEKVALDITAGTFSVTLPTNPAQGDSVVIAVVAGSPQASPVVVQGNGNLIAGETSISIDIPKVSVEFMFTGSEWGVS